jgi:hypothetical protein
MPPLCAGGGVGLAATMGALYTGRGPVCGITTRRGATTGRAGAVVVSGVVGAGDSVWSELCAGEVSFAFAVISAAWAIGASTTGAGGRTAGATASVFSGAVGGAMGAAGLGETGAFGAVCSAGLGCVAPVAGDTGGFTTTVGGTTVTTGRAAAAPAGAFATTVPAGGFDAMAGAAGGTIAGAGRGCGTIFRGSGRAGAAAGAATDTTGAADLAGVFVVVTAALLGGSWLLRASASASCFFARMAFITSPGLET